MDTVTTLAAPRTTAGIRSLPTSLSLRLTDFFVGLMLVWTAIPETLVEEVYVGEIPVRFLLFYAALASSVLSSLASDRSHLSPFLVVAMLAGTYMAALGFWNGNELKYWTIDVSNFCGLLLGLHWAREGGADHAARLLRFWARGLAVILLLNIVGLLCGVIAPAHDSIRRYSFSLFSSTAFLICVFPLWFTATRSDQPVGRWRVVHLYPVFAMAIVLLAALISATRSMFLAWTCSVLILLWISLNGRNAIIGLLATSTICFALFLAAFGNSHWRESLLADRILSTDLTTECRHLEIQMMFDDLAGDGYRGEGFGSRFRTCIGGRPGTLAYAPHVGALTLWYKGGLPIFLALVLLPAARGVYAIVFERLNSVWGACWAGAVLYLIQASMSGGWGFEALFMYGVFLQLAWSVPRRSD